MKNKKIIILISLIFIAVVSVFTFGYNKLLAATDTLYVGLSKFYKDSFGYGIKDPKHDGMRIWKIQAYETSDKSGAKASNELYCIKAGYGTTWNGNSEDVVEYNEKLDFLNKTEIQSSSTSEVVKTFVNGNYYTDVLWILSQAYIPTSDSGKNETAKKNLLEAAGIKYQDGSYVYTPRVGYDYTSDVDPNFLADGYSIGLTDDDIKVVQQAAIWYFTNYGEEKYSQYENKDWLTYTEDGDNYSELSEYHQMQNKEGQMRNDEMTVLYKYLIDSAKNNNQAFTEEGEFVKQKSPLKFIKQGTPYDEDIYHSLDVKRVSDRYVIGPVQITKVNDAKYSIELDLQDQGAQKISDYKFVNQAGEQLNKELEELVESGEQFYISTPTTGITKVIVNFKTSFRKLQEVDVWTKTGQEEQPLVEPTQMLVPEETGYVAYPTTGTYKVQIKKVDENGEALTGAKFTVNSHEVNTAEGIGVLDSNIEILNTNQITKTYEISEITAPTGYIGKQGTINATIELTITEEGHKYKVSHVDLRAQGTDVQGIKVEVEDNVITIKIPNSPKQGQYGLELIKAEKTGDGEPTEITSSEATFTVQKQGALTQEYHVRGHLVVEEEKEINKDNVDEVDTYTIKETVPPDKYSKFDGTIKVEVHKKETDTGYEIDEAKTKVTVTDAGGRDITSEENAPVSYKIQEGQIVVTVLNEEVTKTGEYNLKLIKAEKSEEGRTEQILTSAATFEVTKGVKGGQLSTETVQVTGELELEQGKQITKDTFEQVDVYTIKETVPPDDYSKFDGTITIEVHKKEETGQYVVDTQTTTKQVLAGDGTDITGNSDGPVYVDISTGEIVVTVLNEEIEKTGEYDLTLVKAEKDAEGNIDVIEDGTATFEITKAQKDQEGTTETQQVTGTLTVEDNKQITDETVEIVDTYTIKETVPPDEYCKFDGTIYIEVHKKEDNGKYVVDEAATVKKVTDAEGTDITSEVDVPVYFDVKTGQIVVTVINYPDGKFDLALRKKITKVEDAQGKVKVQKNAQGENNARGEIVPGLDELNANGTAKYPHRKDPVIVEENDIVTYSLTIYNEGDKAGTATKIVDQLPAGMILNTGTTTVTSNTGNVYRISYSPTTNQVTLTLETKAKEIPAYNGETLSSETIELKCKVTAEPDEKSSKVLTNVAWIDEEYNAVDDKTITNQEGEDRDSTPDKNPNVNQNNTQDYSGNEQNKPNLGDDDYFYRGEEDDDDFEKVEVLPKPKTKFDLALRKYITAISEDANIEEGEYVTDTKRSTGEYLREPQITVQNGQIKYTHPKTALKVANGDYVEYTIRVYNEGEEAGYAEEVTDYIYKNQGLQYAVGNAINAKYGWKMYDAQGKETTDVSKAVTIKTNYLSKANEGKEGENLLQAFDPAKEISDTNPDYRELKIVFKVTAANSSKEPLINIAEITDDADENGDEVDDIDSTPGSDKEKYPEGKGPQTEEHEDDIDYDVVIPKYFDLALFKFIAAVSSDPTIQDGEYVTDTKNKNGKYTRAPVVQSISANGVVTYKEDAKEPLLIKTGDYILYTIRVYNEGELDGYASEIKDALPEGLEFVVEDRTYNAIWTLSYVDGRQVVTTDWYAKGKGAEDGALEGETGYNANRLKALDPTKAISEENPDYIDAYVLCKVTEKEDSDRVLVNQAQISDDQGPDGDEIEDKDSTPDEWIDEDDDQDDERVKLYCFDLALRKFITEVDGEKIPNSREPIVDTSKMGTKDENGEIITSATYTHPKEPLTLVVGNVVTYTIRVYNEGEIDGYAAEIEDDIPEYLEYLPQDTTNIEYKWEMYDKDGNKTDNVEDAVIVRTTYLSKENEKVAGENLIKAKTGAELSYKDVKISFKIKDPSSTETIITNYAQVSKHTDPNGNDLTDRDSTPGEWEDKDDDQDIENVKVEYFDLSLIKYLSKVIVKEDGKEKITETGYNREINNTPAEKMIKVEIARKKLQSTEVRFVYTIEVMNEGQIPGYAKEITDRIPEGLEFIANENPGWTDEGNNVISTRMLENTLLQPGQTASVQVTLKWKNGNDNFGAKVNTAEISEDYNDRHVPDRDSTPDNNVPEEDDQDNAEVILNIKTGIERTYFGLTLIVLVTVAAGIALIKKFVL